MDRNLSDDKYWKGYYKGKEDERRQSLSPTLSYTRGFKDGVWFTLSALVVVSIVVAVFLHR